MDIKPALNGQDAQKKWVTVDEFRGRISRSWRKPIGQMHLISLQRNDGVFLLETD
ncbi:MAG: hypothetical protein JRF31_05745 [Deltaproteobacteria bacterium]|nr:hypothetical protein [Deltaproteobacteria bacterium]MBW2320346.1 hypothetical protein [Deltaproteobacteria bacterium]